MKELFTDISKKTIKSPFGRATLFAGIALTEQFIGPVEIHAQNLIQPETQITISIPDKRLVQTAASALILGYGLGVIAHNLRENDRSNRISRFMGNASVVATIAGAAAGELVIWTS